MYIDQGMSSYQREGHVLVSTFMDLYIMSQTIGTHSLNENGLCLPDLHFGLHFTWNLQGC